MGQRDNSEALACVHLKLLQEISWDCLQEKSVMVRIFHPC